MPAERTIEQVYAHFHRVMAELLTELMDTAEVTWLAESGHNLSGDYSSNEYSPAIYSLSSLGPYATRLAELDSVQAEALELTGRSRPGRNLLPPLSLDGVTHVRIGKHVGQTGRTISLEAGLGRLRQLEETLTSNLQEFEQYASRHDPRRKALEGELKDMRQAIRKLEQSAATELRETYRQTVIRPYVYFHDGSSEQLHMRASGLIVAGPDVTVDWRQGPRRRRSDKIDIEPLVSVGAFSFHDLSDWERAKEAARTKRTKGT